MYLLQWKAHRVRYAYKEKHGSCIVIYTSKCFKVGTWNFKTFKYWALHKKFLSFFREAYPEASVVDVQFAYNISDLVKLDKNRSVFQNIVISQYGNENKHLSVKFLSVAISVHNYTSYRRVAEEALLVSKMEYDKTGIRPTMTPVTCGRCCCCCTSCGCQEVSS